MKRLTAIGLLLVLLFNLCGYQWVFAYLQKQHDTKLTAQLDKDAYRNEDLISIKTPLSMPYYNRTLDFERVDGAIQIDGVEYRYVKRRIVNDSLELLCLPNPEKQKLQTAKTDYFKIANDVQRPEDGKKAATVIKAAAPEFCNTLQTYNLLPPQFTKQTYTPFAGPALASCLLPIPGQPPETTRSVS